MTCSPGRVPRPGLAQILSVGGDQLARVALTYLVYDRTGSALLAAITFAASIVPTFVGGVVMGGLGTGCRAARS